MQKINTDNLGLRLKTGPLKVDDDWTGLFIRGDDCIDLAMKIDYLCEKFENVDLTKDFMLDISIQALKGYSELIKDKIDEGKSIENLTREDIIELKIKHNRTLSTEDVEWLLEEYKSFKNQKNYKSTMPGGC